MLNNKHRMSVLEQRQIFVTRTYSIDMQMSEEVYMIYQSPLYNKLYKSSLKLTSRNAFRCSAKKLITFCAIFNVEADISLFISHGSLISVSSSGLSM